MYIGPGYLGAVGTEIWNELLTEWYRLPGSGA